MKTNFKQSNKVSYSIIMKEENFGSIFQNPFSDVALSEELLKECELRLQKVSGYELTALLEVLDINADATVQKDDEGHAYLPTLVAFHKVHKKLGTFAPRVIVGGARLHYLTHKLKNYEADTLAKYETIMQTEFAKATDFNRNKDAK